DRSRLGARAALACRLEAGERAKLQEEVLSELFSGARQFWWAEVLPHLIRCRPAVEGEILIEICLILAREVAHPYWSSGVLMLLAENVDPPRRAAIVQEAAQSLIQFHGMSPL